MLMYRRMRCVRLWNPTEPGRFIADRVFEMAGYYVIPYDAKGT